MEHDSSNNVARNGHGVNEDKKNPQKEKDSASAVARKATPQPDGQKTAANAQPHSHRTPNKQRQPRRTHPHKTPEKEQWTGSWTHGPSPFFESPDRTVRRTNTTPAKQNGGSHKVGSQSLSSAEREKRGSASPRPKKGGHRSASTSKLTHGMVTFPMLPRGDFEEDEKFDLDEEYRLARYQSLRSGFSLTSVLNNPGYGEEEPLPFAENVPPSLSDYVLKLGDLDQYVKIVGPAAAAFEFNRRVAEAEGAPVTIAHLATSASTMSINSVDGDEENASHRKARLRAEKRRQARRTRERILRAEREAEKDLVKCLEIVPAVYFRPQFRLSDPGFFIELSDRPDSMLLQEQLSLYLDTVELNLQKQISARSHSFFSALLSIQDLYNEVSEGLSAIDGIREHVQALKQRMVSSTMDVVRKKRRAANLKKLSSMLESMEEVVRAQNAIRTLLSEEEFSSALELIQRTRSVLQNDLAGLHSMAFVDIKLNEMTILIEKLICSEFVQVAVHGLEYLRLQERMRDNGEQNASPPPSPTSSGYSSLSPAEVALVSSQVLNLGKIGKLAVLISAYRDELTQQVTDTLKEVVSTQLRSMIPPTEREVKDETTGKVKTLSLAEQVRLLSHSQFLRLLDAMFSGLRAIVERMGCVKQTVLDTLGGHASSPSSNGGGGGGASSSSAPSSSDGTTVVHLRNISTSSVVSSSSAASSRSTDISDLKELDILQKQFTRDFHGILCGICEYTHSRCARIVSLRAAVTVDLQLHELKEFFDTTLTFVTHSEQLCSKTFYGLRSSLLTQAKAFLETFHSSSMNKLASSLEKELWKRIEVPREYQILIDHGFIRKGDRTRTGAASPRSPRSPRPLGVPDPSSGTEVSPRDSSGTSSLDESKTAGNSVGVGGDGDGSKSSRVLFVMATDPETGRKSFEKYPVVQSMLILLDIIATYMECASYIEAVGTEVVHRLIELLKFFNSRSCQLVLGAGAMHVAGLDSIKAKHLVLSAQCLGLVIAQVPVLKKFFSTKLPTKHHVVLVGLDKVGDDYTAHQREIFDKIVSIVTDLVEMKCRAMLKNEWCTLASEPRVGPAFRHKADQQIKDLMKQAVSLHRVLSDLLPARHRDTIFVKVTEQFSSIVCKYMSRVNASLEYVRKQVSVNVSHVLKRLRMLDGLNENVCTELEVFVVPDV